MIDKNSWGVGPWSTEPDRKEWRDADTGLPCLAIRHPSLGHWCGYVAITPNHPSHGLGWEDIDVNVHGGLTYAEACSEHVCHVPLNGEPDNVWWLGFDCAHAGDLSPGMGLYIGSRSKYRTLSYVEQQCTSLARQINAMARVL